jgi:phosphate starvation-inducible PhoH-like protein
MSVTVRFPEGRLDSLLGPYDENLKLIERSFGVQLTARGDTVSLRGEEAPVSHCAAFLEQLVDLLSRGHEVGGKKIRLALKLYREDPHRSLADFFSHGRVRVRGKREVAPKSDNQRRYVEEIRANDMVFAVGPAGTGKTYLAVAMAVSLLEEGRVNRIVLCRPAVEAGERLGFLPGDLVEKVSPYLRPLYDALFDLLDPARAGNLIDEGTIEIAPLAFMRGRTLNDAFIILDEAQNTTTEQMKMFVTRMGFNSKAVITGDVTQIDLAPERTSGLVEARRVVAGVPGIAFLDFDERDVVRHPLVQRLVKAYDLFESERQAKGEGAPGAGDRTP